MGRRTTCRSLGFPLATPRPAPKCCVSPSHFQFSRAGNGKAPAGPPSKRIACGIGSCKDLTELCNQGALEDPRGSRYSESPPPSANRIRAHMAFIWACCAVVSGTTFLGLQFQMDWVGAVSFLS